MGRSLPVSEPHLTEKSLLWEGLPVLSARVSLPRFSGPGAGVRRMNRYYRHVEARLLAWLNRRYPRLCAEAQAALEAARPIPMEEVTADYQLAGQTERELIIRWQLALPNQPLRQMTDRWALPSGLPEEAPPALGQEQSNCPKEPGDFS